MEAFDLNSALLFIELLCISTSCYEETYLGCFSDDNEDRVFKYMQSLPNMTLSKCFQHCGAHNFSLAGLEYGTQCYCGKDSDTFARYGKLSDSSCSHRCKGGDKCGGSRSGILVYEGDKRLGCFNDSLDLKSMTGGYHKDLTIDNCVSTCKSDYAIIGYGTHCYCDTEKAVKIESLQTLPDKTCNQFACLGQDTCGGYRALSLYNISESNTERETRKELSSPSIIHITFIVLSCSLLLAAIVLVIYIKCTGLDKLRQTYVSVRDSFAPTYMQISSTLWHPGNSDADDLEEQSTESRLTDEGYIQLRDLIDGPSGPMYNNGSMSSDHSISIFDQSPRSNDQLSSTTTDNPPLVPARSNEQSMATTNELSPSHEEQENTAGPSVAPSQVHVEQENTAPTSVASTYAKVIR